MEGYPYGYLSDEQRVLEAAQARPRDVRGGRNLSQRRLIISILRRFLRVVSLHVVDGLLLGAVVLLLADGWAPFSAARDYAAAITVVCLLGLNARSAYSPGDARRDHGRLASGMVLAGMILACLSVFPPRLPLPPSFFLVSGILGFAALALGRRVVDQLVRQAYVRGIGLRRAVMIGSLDDVGGAILQLRDHRRIDQYIEGHLSPDDEPDPTALGVVSELPTVLDTRDVQEVIITTTLSPKTLQWIADRCFETGVSLYVIPHVIGTVDCRAEPMQVGACPMLRLHPARLEFPALLAKRHFDLLIAGIFSVLSAPLILLVAVAIKLDSPGPVFYRARRIGLGGRSFLMWKFRSMYVDAEEREKDLAHLNIYDGGTFKIKDDPRVTRIGRILRRTSMDELPQLLNVISGEMSLVGPRPALPGDLDRYKPHHFERLSVIPGMTGPWQVNGRNLITDFEVVVRMERAYIRSWSLLLDIKILIRTIKVVISGEGAY